MNDDDEDVEDDDAEIQALADDMSLNNFMTADGDLKLRDTTVSTSRSAPAAAVAAIAAKELRRRGNWLPKTIMAQHVNPDGIRGLTCLVALTSGVAQVDNSKVDIALTNDGQEQEPTVTEAFHDDMTDLGEFYNNLPRNDGESEAEFTRKRFAMEDAVRDMKKSGNTTSIYKIGVPFRCDPTEKHVQICGMPNGSRFAHIDLSEKKKIKKQGIVMMGRASTRGSPKGPTHGDNTYSNIGA